MIGPKARLEFLVLVVLLTLGLALRHPGLLLLAIPVAWHLTLGFALVPPHPERSLRVQRTVKPVRLVEGGVVHVTLEVKNLGKTKLDLRVCDGPYPGFLVVRGQWQRETILSPGETLLLSYEACPARGVYSLRAVSVEVLDPLRLSPRQLDFPCPAEVLVLPRYEDLSRMELAVRRTLAMPGTVRARRGGVGLEFYGVREYRPGESIRRLAWKALARRDELVIVEFDEERVAEVAVVLDVRTQAYRTTSPELFPWAVRAAAALSQYHLRQGHRVALLKYGAYLDWVFPGYGRRHGERILRELARAELGESKIFADLDHLPTRLLPPGSLILLVSPLLFGDEEPLGKLVARGYHVVVVMPASSSAGLAGLDSAPELEIARRIMALERGILLRRLRRSGVIVVVWDVRRPLSPLVRKLRSAVRVWR